MTLFSSSWACRYHLYPFFILLNEIYPAFTLCISTVLPLTRCLTAYNITNYTFLYRLIQCLLLFNRINNIYIVITSILRLDLIVTWIHCSQIYCYILYTGFLSKLLLLKHGWVWRISNSCLGIAIWIWFLYLWCINSSFLRSICHHLRLSPLKLIPRISLLWSHSAPFWNWAIILIRIMGCCIFNR